LIAFKLWSDPFVGKLVFFRVYSGTLSKGDTVYNPRTTSVSDFAFNSDPGGQTPGHRDLFTRAISPRLLESRTSRLATRFVMRINPILLDRHRSPIQLFQMAIERRRNWTRKNGDRVATPCGRRPTFRVYTHEDTGQTIIAGMGELHLEIIRDRMFREFKVDANAGKPQIAYRETITSSAHGVGKLIKQSGGRGQYGHVEVDVRPPRAGKV